MWEHVGRGASRDTWVAASARGICLSAGPPACPRALGPKAMVFAMCCSKLCHGFPVPSV